MSEFILMALVQLFAIVSASVKKKIYDSYRTRVTTAGNIDVVTIVRGADEAALREAVASCVAAVKTPLTRYILMPSFDLPADTRIGNVRAFLAGADR